MHERCPLLALAAALLCAPSALAQGRNVTIKATQVSGNIYMLEGQGGNMGLSIGEDGAVLIDDQFAPLTGKIVEAVEKLDPGRIRFVINTHWHGDHTGGNENLGEAGAIIVAHENVRERMSVDQFIEAFNSRTPAAPQKALPVVTFDRALTLHWNGDAIRLLHVAPAHTDGDSFVHFEADNVLHMGDTFFNGMYPFIDASTGGNLPGMLAAVELALTMIDGETKIIPGHGPLADRAALEAYRAMLATVDERIGGMIEKGTTRDDVIAAKPTADLDATWGGGFLAPDVWVGIVFDGYANAVEPHERDHERDHDHEHDRARDHEHARERE